MSTLKLKIVNDIIVFVGRFQPAHNAHLQIISEGLSKAKNVIICIGSAYSPRTPKNPFTSAEREDLIRSAFSTIENDRLHFCFIPDTRYNNQQWAMNVVNEVADVVSSLELTNPTIGIIGHQKSGQTTEYLQMFPQWNEITFPNIKDMHATSIRDYYFNEKWAADGSGEDIFVAMCENQLNANVFDWLCEWRHTTFFEHLQEEYSTIISARMERKDKFPIIDVTVDAVVVQSGHILLVRRKLAPGKGLWALPGGYLNEKEWIEDAVIRELREETKITVPAPVLRGSIKGSKVFDHPERSEYRGRIITHAHLIELNPGPLPKVKGSDDAEKAKWIPLSDVLEMSDQLFEDHADIINYFLGRV